MAYFIIFFTVLETLVWQVALAVGVGNDNTESFYYLYYVYSQGRSCGLSVKLLSKFRMPQSKSSTDVWPRAAWQTCRHTKLTRYGYMKLERPEQCLWSIIQRVCVKLFTVSVTLQRHKKSLCVFTLIRNLRNKTSWICSLSLCVCFIGYGVCHKQGTHYNHCVQYSKLQWVGGLQTLIMTYIYICTCACADTHISTHSHL